MMTICAIMFALESCIRRLEERRHRTHLNHLEWDDEMFVNVTEPKNFQDM